MTLKASLTWNFMFLKELFFNSSFSELVQVLFLNCFIIGRRTKVTLEVAVILCFKKTIQISHSKLLEKYLHYLKGSENQ